MILLVSRYYLAKLYKLNEEHLFKMYTLAE